MKLAGCIVLAGVKTSAKAIICVLRLQSVVLCWRLSRLLMCCGNNSLMSRRALIALVKVVMVPSDEMAHGPGKAGCSAVCSASLLDL